MRRSLRGGIVVLTLLAGSAATAAAQETGTPIFKAPYRAFQSHEFGASLSDPGEGSDFAIEGFYRYGKGQHDFSIRGGFEDVAGSNTRFLIGGDFRTQVLSYSESFPLDGALTLGLGGLFGEGDDVVLLPIGISLGRRFDVEGSSTTFVPYVHPNIVPTFGSGDDDIQFTLGLGVDIRFSERWAVRASGGLGDIEGVGITVAYVR
jgi:opacity protein-like surface antigen